jgi:hypothetical protein
MERLEQIILRPRQVRYQAALRPDMTSRIDSKVLSNAVTTANHDFFLNRAKIVPIPCSLHGDRARMRSCFFSRHLVGMAVQLLQSFALHLQFHLRILLEDLLVSLTKHLGYPLVGHATGTESRGIGRAEVVKAKIRNLGSPQCRFPSRFQGPQMPAQAFLNICAPKSAAGTAPSCPNKEGM